MKYQDIVNEYSRIAIKGLNHGIININHMHSCETGELTHIDYVDHAELDENPNHMYRVLIKEDTVRLKNVYKDVTRITVAVLYYDFVTPNRTVWNSNGKTILEKVYYQIGEDYYTECFDEVVAAYRRRRDRLLAWDHALSIMPIPTSNKYNTLVARYVKHKIYRFASDISICKTSTGYWVEFRKKNGDFTGEMVHLSK